MSLRSEALGNTASLSLYVGLLAVLAVAGCEVTKRRHTGGDRRWMNFTSHASEEKANAAAAIGRWKYLAISSATRGTSLPVVASHSMITADIARQLPAFAVQTVAAGRIPSFPITYLGGAKVTNFAELLEAFEWQETRPYQVDFAVPDATGQLTAEAVELDAAALSRWLHVLNQEQTCVRFNRRETPWYFLRSGPVQCRFTGRCISASGIVQLSLEVQAVDGAPLAAPRDLRLEINGQPATCLNAAQVLERLYRPEQEPGPTAGAPVSFAQLVADEEFAVPKNYAALAQDEQNAMGGAWLLPSGAPPYPGGGLLGDARALSGLMLDQSIITPHKQPKAGWVFFGYPPAVEISQAQLVIDLGYGEQQIDLTLPVSDD